MASHAHDPAAQKLEKLIRTCVRVCGRVWPWVCVCPCVSVSPCVCPCGRALRTREHSGRASSASTRKGAKKDEREEKALANARGV